MFTAQELADCAAREVVMRKWVYPARVEAGKMTRKAADKEIMMMEQIARHFQALAGKEQAGLFADVDGAAS